MQDRLPLAELVAERRARLSLSLAAVARRMHDAADDEGSYSGATRQTIHEIEQGRIPHPDPLRWLAVALELPVKQVVDAARRQRMNRRQLLGGAVAVGGAMLLPAKAKALSGSVPAIRRALLALRRTRVRPGRQPSHPPWAIDAASGHQPRRAPAASLPVR